MYRKTAAIFLTALLSWRSPTELKADQPVRVDFNQHIRPIISNTCFECHGPDAKQRKAKLRLDLKEGIFRKRKGIQVVVPGKPAESEMIRRITADDPDDQMPPPDFRHKLNDSQIALIRKWIRQGAEYQGLWSFIPPKRGELPKVKNQKWVRNPIDYYILSNLEDMGLKPSSEASSEALLRRVTFDLTGLPPTLEEIDAFLEDKKPGAYEKVLDRLLKSSRYGEHMARYWLDLARYADTNGYQYDTERTQWAWRDWVIYAYNDNLPFDQFTIEQLAGDMLPNATIEQRVATGFNRNHGITIEGGVIDEEYRTEYVIDRLTTTATVWMGITMGCARCHDHKFDPISQKEFYQFFAFFNQVPERGLNGFAPRVKTPTRWHKEQFQRIDGLIAGKQKQIEAIAAGLADDLAKWEAGYETVSNWQSLQPDEAESEDGSTLKIQDGGAILVSGKNPPNDTYTVTADLLLKKLSAIRLEALPHESLPLKGPGRAGNGNFVLTSFNAIIRPSTSTVTKGRFIRVSRPGTKGYLQIAELQAYSGNENVARKGKPRQSTTGYGGTPQRGIDGNTNGNWAGGSITHTTLQQDPWWEVDLMQTHELDRLVIWNRTDCCQDRLDNSVIEVLDENRQPVWQGKLSKATTTMELSLTGERVVIFEAATSDFSQKDYSVANTIRPVPRRGWAVHPEIGKAHSAVYIPAAPYEVPEGSALWVQLKHTSHPAHGIGHLRLSVTDDPNVIKQAKLPPHIIAIMDVPARRRTPEQNILILSYYATTYGPEKTKNLQKEIARFQAERKEIGKTVPQTLVMQEMPNKRQTFFLNRGQYDQKGERVSPGVPSSLPPLPKGAQANRLGMAQWLVDPGHPLTSRVTVNRYWQKYFGTGIVKTLEDLGSQAELPTHPELLDWLATEFVRSGWDIKHMQRLIVTSATYRQSSDVTPAILERDPENRNLARGPRIRLDAEMIRDNALYISGLLFEQIGGKSVYPYQPAGLWMELNNRPGYSRKYKKDQGNKLFRRSMYTFWKRTVPPPSMQAFDAPGREFCTARRSRTNTPLQALVLLHDPQFVEAARHLAERMMTSSGKSSKKRIAYAFRLATARRPKPEELKLLLSVYNAELKEFKNDKQAALKLLSVGDSSRNEELDPVEHAALATIARIILNLDETITKN